MNKRMVLLSILSIMLITGCGLPIFRSDEELFAAEPEIVAQVQPYLTSWATRPPERTVTQRRDVASEIDGIWTINIAGERITDDGNTIYIIDIPLEVWGDWSRGYFYVHDGSELSETSHLRLRRVDEHWYIYNRNE